MAKKSFNRNSDCSCDHGDAKTRLAREEKEFKRQYHDNNRHGLATADSAWKQYQSNQHRKMVKKLSNGDPLP